MAVTIRLIAAISTLSTLLVPGVVAVPAASSTSPAITPLPNSFPFRPLPNKAKIISGPILTGSTNLPPGAPVPSSIYNPNGPYYNPNDYASPALNWPGKPTAPDQPPPPRPTVAPSAAGGPKASEYRGPAWIPVGLKGLIPSLPQSDTNGNSKWGLIDFPPLPPYGGGGKGKSSSSVRYPSSKPPSSSKAPTSTKAPGGGGYPTGGGGYPTTTLTRRSSSTSSAGTKTSSSSYPTYTPPGGNSSLACGKMPDTGVTKYYDFTVSYQKIAPDGVEKNGLVINGGFPGPLIEANWGDWIEVTVHNNLTDEGTALHWHGILQTESPWFDGVPSVSQCPIPPGDTLVYKFRADLYGSSWYHSHYSAQYAGGALGPILIHGPQTADYDIDLGPVMLTDWYHQDYFTLVNNTMNGLVPASDNNLINGKMNYPCASTTQACTPNAGISKFQFKSGKKHLIRLINTSAEGIQKFTIDGHNFTVISNDFVPVVPYQTNVITLGVAQRSEIIVEGIGKPTDAFWMRSDLGTLGAGCSVTTGVSPQAVAAVYYESANTTAEPTTTTGLTPAQLADCGNDPLEQVTALCPITPDPAPPATETINIVFGNNGTNFVWFMNGVSFRGDYNHPVLKEVKDGNLTFPTQWNVFDFGSNSSVRIIIKNTFQFGAHPMHFHGHNFHVLAEGFGDWDGTVVNPTNTQRRDVQLVRPARDANTPAFIVLQYTQDNPAVWPLHCHIAWHVSGGLYVNVLERPADIQQRVFPASVQDTCNSWNNWTSANIPDQIDSGLKI